MSRGVELPGGLDRSTRRLPVPLTSVYLHHVNLVYACWRIESVICVYVRFEARLLRSTQDAPVPPVNLTTLPQSARQ